MVYAVADGRTASCCVSCVDADDVKVTVDDVRLVRRITPSFRRLCPRVLRAAHQTPVTSLPSSLPVAPSVRTPVSASTNVGTVLFRHIETSISNYLFVELHRPTEFSTWCGRYSVLKVV